MQERATRDRGRRAHRARARSSKAGQNRRFAGEDLKAGQVVLRARPADPPGRARHDRVARHRRSERVTAGCASRSSRPATSCGRSARRSRAGRDLRQQPLHALRHAARASTATSLDMGVVPDVPDALERAFATRGRERRRRHHVGRRVGRRGRFRQAAARQAGRGAVLEDRDEAGTPARLRQDRRRALLRAAGQSGLGDGDVLPVRARRAAASCRDGATSRRCRCSRRTLAAPIRKVPGRTEFQRGILAPDGQRRLRRCARPATRARASCRRCRRRTASSCCPPTPATCAAGEPVDVQLLEG